MKSGGKHDISDGLLDLLDEPHFVSTKLHTLDSPVSPSLTFGMIRTCTGACGLISLNAKTLSSS